MIMNTNDQVVKCEASATLYVLLCLKLLILISYCKAYLVLTPSEDVYVCTGGTVNLTCSTNGTYLEVDVEAPPGINRKASYSPVVLSSFDVIDSMQSLFISDSIAFNISKFVHNSSLTALVSAENVTSSFNGSRIQCSTVSNGVTLATLTTNIYIISNAEADHILKNLPNASISEEFIRTDAVAVILNVTSDSLVTYSVSAVPWVDMTMTGNTSVKFIIPYNIQHNISIEASLCGCDSTSILRLNYAKCDYPIPQLANDVVAELISDYGDLALEETNITFSCASEMRKVVRMGPSTSSCTGDGQWKPDPRKVQCKANCSIPVVKGNSSLSYNSTLEGSVMMVQCEDIALPKFTVTCHRDGNWSPDPFHTCLETSVSDAATVTVLVATSLAGSLVGILLIFGITISSCAIVKRIKGSLNTKKNLRCEMNHQTYQGEYSLVQYSAEEMDTSNNRVAGKNTTLVYADIGPMSLNKHRSGVPTLHLIDDKVEYAQLTAHADKDINMLTQRTNTRMDTHPADHQLNLDSLLIQLKPTVTDQWYKYGEAIGVNKELLEKCTQYSSEESIIEILDNWLRNHKGQPTWYEVADALDVIGLQCLATDIRNVYKTGKLPIEVNMNPNIPNSIIAPPSESPPPEIPPRMHID